MNNNNKILIIEDELPLLEILTDELANEGYEVIKATNGKEGLEAALNNHPKLILLDILMPVMDGMKVITELRKDTWGKEATIVFLTNLAEPLKDITTPDLSNIDYIVKSDMPLSKIVEFIKQKLTLSDKIHP